MKNRNITRSINMRSYKNCNILFKIRFGTAITTSDGEYTKVLFAPGSRILASGVYEQRESPGMFYIALGSDMYLLDNIPEGSFEIESV